MINQLYTFTVGTYVVADEWNANFKVLANSNADCVQAIEDAEVSVAFPDDDLTQLFNAVRKKPDSEGFSSTEQSITLNIAAGKEYYGTLTGTQDLFLSIPKNMNGEARVAVMVAQERSLRFFDAPGAIINDGGFDKFRAGYYFILIYETNGLAQVKLIWTGV